MSCGLEEHDVVEGSESPEAGLAEAFAGLGVVVLAEDGVLEDGHVEEAGGEVAGFGVVAVVL